MSPNPDFELGSLAPQHEDDFRALGMQERAETRRSISTLSMFEANLSHICVVSNNMEKLSLSYFFSVHSDLHQGLRERGPSCPPGQAEMISLRVLLSLKHRQIGPPNCAC
jgi:hypothetical protein